MPARPLSILSQSSLQDYADCPRRFQLRYLDHLNYPALESEPALENERNQREGEYFHRLAQQALLGLDGDRLARLAHSPDLSRWWQNFLDHRPELDGCTVYTEFTLTAPLGGLRLVAKYDVIAVRDGAASIYDWKTYRTRPKNEWLAARWQTRVYLALLCHSGAFLNAGRVFPAEGLRMFYWFADFPAEPAVITYSAEQFSRDWDVLRKLAEELPCAPGFPQSEDQQKCGFCTYRSYCDRGTRAAQGFEFELQSAPGALFDLNFEQIAEIAF
ncbi:MAG: PD-(D/E)XK nuclease family protein [Bacteroidota bacterium]